MAASFSAEVKNELAREMPETPCCRVAELAALMRMGGTVAIGSGKNIGLNFTTENAAVARKALTLLKEGFQLRTEVMVSRARRLKKHNSYFVRVVPGEDVKALLARIGILQGESFSIAGDRAVLRKTCCRQAYLRGAFLGGGSVNRPEGGGYHLELVTGNYKFAETLVSICKKFDLPVGWTDRKNDYVVYLKDGDAIMDFLEYVGADETLTTFEVARNVKDVRNQVNRLVNCETANLQKTVDAAYRQVERIRYIEQHKGLDKLPKGLAEIARLRLALPQASLQELADECAGKIGKSGINHRLRKLESMAADMIEEEKHENQV